MTQTTETSQDQEQRFSKLVERVIAKDTTCDSQTIHDELEACGKSLETFLNVLDSRDSLSA